MTKTCPKCGIEVVIFPNVLGHPEPIGDKCLGCGAKLKKTSLWHKIKTFVKWDSA
ncbi:MAG: hypothetical protein V1836_01745 [Candidatus Aenigmatarchaeota archaeon]